LTGRIYLTEVDIVVDGDTRFPEFLANDFVERYSQQCFGNIPSRFSILQHDNCDAVLNIEELRVKNGT
jgi:hypothetical protein